MAEDQEEPTQGMSELQKALREELKKRNDIQTLIKLNQERRRLEDIRWQEHQREVEKAQEELNCEHWRGRIIPRDCGIVTLRKNIKR